MNRVPRHAIDATSRELSENFDTVANVLDHHLALGGGKPGLERQYYLSNDRREEVHAAPHRARHGKGVPLDGEVGQCEGHAQHQVQQSADADAGASFYYRCGRDAAARPRAAATGAAATGVLQRLF